MPPLRQATDITDYLSDHAKELMQDAARFAVEFKRRDIDTKHILLALLDQWRRTKRTPSK